MTQISTIFSRGVSKSLKIWNKRLISSKSGIDSELNLAIEAYRQCKKIKKNSLIHIGIYGISSYHQRFLLTSSHSVKYMFKDSFMPRDVEHKENVESPLSHSWMKYFALVLDRNRHTSWILRSNWLKRNEWIREVSTQLKIKYYMRDFS